MDEKELALLDDVLLERVNMLLSDLKKPYQEEDFSQAENIIKNLPDKDREMIENYINQIINLIALEETFLYKNGFIDGVKVFKTLMKF